MKTVELAVAMALLVLSAIGIAHANTITPSPGETLALTGTADQTSPCCSTGSFNGSFTLGTEIGSTGDWTVTAFNVVPEHCGSSDCSTLPWIFSLEFDASNDTLFGSASALFTGSGGDSRQIVATFLDGNNTSDPYENNDLTNPDNSRSGTFAYTVSAVPEPSAFLLLGSGVLGLAGVIRRKLRV